MDKRSRIENEDTLKAWCREVNQPTTSKVMCDLQDIYARSDIKTLKDLFLAQSQNDKELTIFCVHKAMGSDAMFRLMKAWAFKQANECIEQFLESHREAESELNKKRIELNSQEQGYHNEIKALNGRVQSLEVSLGYYKEELKREQGKSSDLFEQVRMLTEQVTEQVDIIEASTAFEAKIKNMLKAA